MAAYEFNNENVKPRCTLITDASWCPDTHAAGFGGWCAGSNGSGKVGGAIVDPLPSSLIAETVAVCNSMYLALQQSLMLPNSDVMIQIDNVNAIKLYEGKREPSNNHERKAVAWFNATVERYRLTIRFKYIKSHHHVDEAKHYCHNKCDQEAKAFMRQRRSAIRLSQLKSLHGLGCEKNESVVSVQFKELVIRETRSIREKLSHEHSQELDELFELNGW